MNLYTEDIDRIKKVIHVLSPLADELVNITIEIFDENGENIGTVTNNGENAPNLVFVPNKED